MTKPQKIVITDTTRPDRETIAAEQRACVHCGFCNATCPTFTISGMELEGPRGRIELIGKMFATESPPSRQVIRHIDSCLSCYSCETTCPSGVNYSVLIDKARVRIEESGQRLWHARWLRKILSFVITRPVLFRLGYVLASTILRPFRWLTPPQSTVRAALNSTPFDADAFALPVHAPSNKNSNNLHKKPLRVALLGGCVGSVLGQRYRRSVMRLLSEGGCEITVVSGCCGSLPWHLGQLNQAQRLARQWIANLRRAEDTEAFDFILSDLTGCASTLKGFSSIFEAADERDQADAKDIAERHRDPLEIVKYLLANDPSLTLSNLSTESLAVHEPCTLYHGQKLPGLLAYTLKQAGCNVVDSAQAHLCCGSAGVYSILQPDKATELGRNKVAALTINVPVMVATANLPCAMHIRQNGLQIPVRHWSELVTLKYAPTAKS